LLVFGFIVLVFDKKKMRLAACSHVRTAFSGFCLDDIFILPLVSRARFKIRSRGARPLSATEK
jgi:hypothetical protein